MLNDTEFSKSAVESPDTGFDSGAEPPAVAPPVRFGRLALCVATASALALGVVGTVAYGVWFNHDQQAYAEAMAHAFADSASYASDPDFTDDPVDDLGSPAFAAQRAQAILRDRAAPRPVSASAPWLQPGVMPRPPSVGGAHGTTQVVAADRDGNLAALITTIGADFGSLVAVPGTGIVLNNSMINYDPRPGRSNSIAPGKMPFFAVPAIVAARDGRPAFAAAGSGGYPILTGVLSTMIGVVDHRLGVQ